jgi:hypothetical protein
MSYTAYAYEGASAVLFAVRAIAVVSKFCLPQDNSKPGTPMTSKILSAAVLLMGLLLVAECNSATAEATDSVSFSLPTV